MKFKVFSILAMVALVFVFTTTANPAPEEHASETLVQKSEHASEDHHAAAGKSAAAHSHHVKRVKDGKKHHVPINNRRPREAKAATKEHKKGAIATKEGTIKAGATAPIQAPQHAPAVGAASLANKQPSARKPGKPFIG
ncbi:uncharacterized protein LOC124207146 isoform X4 [Daphnia pulex]|uniref:uncharacterized protein LOC124207146 isoform X4 n=1 Tax=Daphnia pulex TaxID=6669 RepID=UPI001EDCC9FC|nr:uncharacterized protein LOC124207146 isoform X4 [Daphnia pulex]